MAAWPLQEITADFAPALIAAKPVKPCDGGVFGAFYLLLFLQRNRAFSAPARSVWADRSGPGQRHARLALVFAAPVFV